MSDAPVDPSDSEHLTVLEALGAKLGTAPKLSLKDEASGQGKSPVLKPTSDETRDALPKGKGNYQLMGELARGGMGVVIKGHDTDLGRDVALKVLHEELAGDPAIVARFVEEAQIGGQLQHPGIVPVYELGLMADERPFFTMKLVKGRTLSELLKQRRELTQDRRRFLSIFEQVCQTIAYAHSRDVIHRDLKPSNIMVGAFGEVQVVDWGLAKVLSNSSDSHQARTAATRISTIDTVRSGSSTTASDSVAGAVMGTPAYMPPEQARGEVEDLGVTADVFALGGLLCQILTGEPPYSGPKDHVFALAKSGDQTELLERLSKCDADRDLVDLTRQCLAPAAADRPENAGEVAARIQGHLAALEDRARQAEVRAARTVGLAVSVVVTLAVAGGAWLWISGERADRRQYELAQQAERDRLEVAQQAERDRLEVAQQAELEAMALARVTERRRETESLVSAALSEASFARGREDWQAAQTALQRARGYLQKEPDAELEKSVDREAQRQASAEKLADEERERSENLAKFLDGMERNRGDLWLISNAQYRRDAYEQAFVDFGIDLTFLSEEEVVGASLESGRPADIALALINLAWFHDELVSGQPKRLSRFATAMDPDPVRSDVRLALSVNDGDRLLELARDAEATEISPLSALVLVSGLRWINAKDHSIRILKRTARLHPSDASVHILLGELLLDSDPEGALLHLSVARGLQPESPYVLQLLGRVHRELGDTLEATRLLRRAVALHDGEPQNHIHLGLALRAGGEESEAQESFRAAAEIDPGCLAEFVGTNVRASNQLYDSGHYEQSAWYARRALEMDGESDDAYFRLAVALGASRAYDEAIAACSRVIAINPNHPYANNSMGVYLGALGRREEAIQSYRRQIEINPSHVFSHANLGDLLLAGGDFEAAIRCFQTKLEISPSNPRTHMRLARAYFGLADHGLARETYRKALALDPEYCNALSELAWFLTNVPDPEFRDAARAVLLAQKAVENHLDQPVYDNIHGRVTHVASLGQAYYRAGRFEECVATLMKALELPQGDPGPGTCFFLAMAHKKLGDTDEASKWYATGVEWMGRHALNVPEQRDLSQFRDEARAVLGE